MKLTQISANNRIHFQDQPFQNHKFSQASSQNDEGCQHSFSRSFFAQQKSIGATSTIASSAFSPTKTSEYSTNQEDISDIELADQLCEDYLQKGFCMKGDACEYLHEGGEKKRAKNRMFSSLLQNFPQLMGKGSSQRMKSFLF